MLVYTKLTHHSYIFQKLLIKKTGEAQIVSIFEGFTVKQHLIFKNFLGM